MRLALVFHGLDLAIEGGPDRRLGTHGGRVGRRHGGRLAQLLAAQRWQSRNARQRWRSGVERVQVQRGTISERVQMTCATQSGSETKDQATGSDEVFGTHKGVR